MKPLFSIVYLLLLFQFKTAFPSNDIVTHPVVCLEVLNNEVREDEIAVFSVDEILAEPQSLYTIESILNISFKNLKSKNFQQIRDSAQFQMLISFIPSGALNYQMEFHSPIIIKNNVFIPVNLAGRQGTSVTFNYWVIISGQQQSKGLLFSTIRLTRPSLIESKTRFSYWDENKLRL